ncbi:hypothetical protein MMC10_010283, partial [Thelotrema lepadinum]|nr:hypothetical protein [Thelotrema lepadinum]
MEPLNLDLMKKRKDATRILTKYVDNFQWQKTDTWLTMFNQHLSLHKKLASHEAMQANMEQLRSTFKTAASRNRLLFLWTYTAETLCWLYTMVPSYGEMDEEHTGYWEIIISRAILTAALILTAEGPSAVVDKLVTRSYDEPSPPKPEFGEDILEVARDMVKSRKDLDASKRSRETWDGLWQRS